MFPRWSIVLKRIVNKLELLVILLMSAAMLSACGDGGIGAGEQHGTLHDARDGKTYRTVTIGSQTWMAENLNFEMAKSYCYADEPYFCSKYGRLYLWSAAMDSVGMFSDNGKGCGHCWGSDCCSPVYPVRGACPEGWHLPSKEEYATLIEFVGGVVDSEYDTSFSGSSWCHMQYLYAGKFLKAKTEWIEGSGTDEYGFSALPGGMFFGAKQEGYDFLGTGAKFYTSSHDGYDGGVVVVELSRYDYIAINGDRGSDLDGKSVRCIKD